MTRKHFELIARMLKEGRELGLYTSPKRYGQLCGMWADELATQNPNFNRYTFLKACGVL